MQNNTTKRIQLVVTIALGLVLFGMVALYIYYGMQLAKKANSTAEVTPDQTPPTNTASTLTRDEKMAILDALVKDSTTTVTTAEKEATLKNLAKNASSSPMTEEDKQKILESLSRNH